MVPAAVGSATENDEIVVQTASIDEVGGREGGTAHNNLQQTTGTDRRGFGQIPAFLIPQ